MCNKNDGATLIDNSDLDILNNSKERKKMSSLIKLVEDLNEDLCNKNLRLYSELGICYLYHTNGYAEVIEFMGNDIYNSEYQKYDKNDEVIEPTVEWVKNEVKDLINEILKSL